MTSLKVGTDINGNIHWLIYGTLCTIKLRILDQRMERNLIAGGANNADGDGVAGDVNQNNPEAADNNLSSQG